MIWLATFAFVAVTGYVCFRTDWVAPAYETLVNVFSFPASTLVRIRRPSQEWLLLIHGRVLLVTACVLMLSWKWWRHATRWLWFAIWTAYLLRALVWGIGGNLPMVQGDSAHHFSIARRVMEGHGPTLPYVHSFIRVYSDFGLVDDWSPPAYAYWLAFAMHFFGATITVAKTATLIINLATIPILFHLAQRKFDTRIALLSAWTLALLPAHVLYAAFMLKESLVCFLTVLACHLFLWLWEDTNRRPLLSAIAAGIAAGLLCLSRQTGFAIDAAMMWFGLWSSVPSKLMRMTFFLLAFSAVISPWGWATYRDYGTPFYSSTNSFRYMTSSPDHFVQRGAPTLDDYLKQPISQIVRDKLIMLWIIVSYYWFVFTPALALGFTSAVRDWRNNSLARLCFWVFAAFVAGTLVNIAAIDQVKDFGRYFLPVLAIMIPAAWHGIVRFLSQFHTDEKNNTALTSVVIVVVASGLWSGLEWTHNYRFLSEPWHEQLVLQQKISDKIVRELPQDAVVMTYYPWELHMYSQRKAVLMPRNFDPKRLRQEANEYGVTHIVLESGFGNRKLLAILQEFGYETRLAEIGNELANEQIGVYPIRPN